MQGTTYDGLASYLEGWSSNVTPIQIILYVTFFMLRTRKPKLNANSSGFSQSLHVGLECLRPCGLLGFILYALTRVLFGICGYM